MRNKYTVDYFLAKFKAIPARRWTTGMFRRDEKRCALGHCGISDQVQSTREGDSLRSIFATPIFIGITSINDYASESFPQKTPRARILAALKYIKSL